MPKRCIAIFGVFIVLLALAACSNKRVSNPIASVDSKQPDKILFDRAMDAMKGGKYDVARLTLQTLINTYPDSEYVARAKLAVGDSWYAEGGSAAMTQAENEYKDFITFFPNMPEAAEAQLKIANIHFREMEKPDRDFTHAMRAEQEYRNLLTQFPDSKLVPEAKERLLEVQEVLAEREYRIGRFYYMRESYVAAIARLKSVADTYPLYSNADDTLFLLGNSYERQAEKIRTVQVNKAFPEAAKARMIKEREDLAAAAYAKIITRYPISDRADDARKQLLAMHYPVPTPTPAAVAQNKAEEASRRAPGYTDKVREFLHRGPDAQEKIATKVGDPVLIDPKQTSAVDEARALNQEMIRAMTPGGGGGGDNKISVETGIGAPPPNEPAPRSDSDTPPGPAPAGDASGIPELTPVPDSSSQPDTTQNALPPTQVNEVANGPDAAGGTSSSTTNAATAKDQTGQATQQSTPDYSTSKHKKKKGLHKLIPF